MEPVKQQRINNIYFHESFPLYRPQVSQVLKQLALATEDADLSTGPNRREYLRERTQLGTRQVLPMSDYAFGCGLVNKDYRLTSLGKMALDNDPLLNTTSIQWLMHYHLSAPTGPGHLFWHELVKRFFQAGEEFTSNDVQSQLSEIIRRIKGTDIAETTLEKTKSAFLSTYLIADGLSALNILSSSEDNTYLVQEPDPPSIWVFGVALLDYWEAHYSTKRTINLDDLYTDGGLGDIFLMGGGRVNSYLRRLEEEGIVELYRVAPPYQLVLLQRDPQPLLERLYAHDEYI